MLVKKFALLLRCPRQRSRLISLTNGARSDRIHAQIGVVKNFSSLKKDYHLRRFHSYGLFAAFPAETVQAIAGCQVNLKVCCKKMYENSMAPGGRLHRYSAKRMAKPVNFVCNAPDARFVSVLGDFNHWDENANPMVRRPDGAWFAAVPMHHGHHRYVFLVDGKRQLDPAAQGVARNDHNERVSLISVS